MEACPVNNNYCYSVKDAAVANQPLKSGADPGFFLKEGAQKIVRVVRSAHHELEVI